MVLLVLVVAISSIGSVTSIYSNSNFTVLEQITKFGYPAESHTVQTEDGYILTLHRIPYGKKSPPGPKKKPVLVQHGLFGSAAVFVIPNPEKALAFILADAGFDVWLNNARGTYYSQKHVVLSPDDPNFWDFSWHEMGVYDLPAVIDLILAHTGHKSLSYIGHSMGTTMFFVMASQRPEYNEKIRVKISLAPVVYSGHARMRRELAAVGDTVELLRDKMGAFAVPTPGHIDLLRKMCLSDSDGRLFCLQMLLLIAGGNSGEMSKDLLPLILEHEPSKMSAMTVIHYRQNLKTGKFQQYDHGPEGNLKKYGNVTPPKYALKNVTAPVAIVYSKGDGMVSSKDVSRLIKKLPNVIIKYKIPLDSFNHIDYMWASNAKKLLYKPMIRILQHSDHHHTFKTKTSHY